MKNQKTKMSKKKTKIIIQNLPSSSKATSELRGAHRPHLMGVGDSARSNGWYRSYSLNKSNGDNALVGANDVARISRGGTLNARGAGELIAGGTLRARDGRDQAPIKMFWICFFFCFDFFHSVDIWIEFDLKLNLSGLVKTFRKQNKSILGKIGLFKSNEI